MLRGLKRRGHLTQLPETAGRRGPTLPIFLAACVLVLGVAMLVQVVEQRRVERMDGRGNSFFDIQAFKDYMEGGDPENLRSDEDAPEQVETIFLADGTQAELRFRWRNPLAGTITVNPNGLREGKPLATAYSEEDMQSAHAMSIEITQRLRVLLALELMLCLGLFHVLKKRAQA